MGFVKYITAIGINNRPGPPERIELTHSVVILLADMVARAAENSDVPPQLRDQLLELRHQGGRGLRNQGAALRTGAATASGRRQFDPPGVNLVELYVRAMRAGALYQWGAPVTESQLYQVDHVASKARREVTSGVQGDFSSAEGELLVSMGEDLLKSAVVAAEKSDQITRANLGSGLQEIGRTILDRLGAESSLKAK